jgi:hypothetical protein
LYYDYAAPTELIWVANPVPYAFFLFWWHSDQENDRIYRNVLAGLGFSVENQMSYSKFFKMNGSLIIS